MALPNPTIGLHYMRTLFLLLLSVSSFELFSARVPIRDTTIKKIKYHFASYREDGTLKTLSEAEKPTGGGHWLFFDSQMNIESEGKYNFEGQKEGKWYFYSRMTFYFIQFKNGRKTGETGHGIRSFF